MSWAIVAGAAITTIGGAMGSKGQGGSTSTQQVMDPRMEPYIFGQNGKPGLLQMTQDQLGRSQSPERMQGWDNVMNRGQGLLNGSVAGNPFSGGGYSGGSMHGLYQGLLQNSQGRYTPPPLPAPAPAPAPNPQMPPTLEQYLAQMRGGGVQDNGYPGGY